MTPPTLADVVSGARHVEFVASDALHVAFLAERPVRPGHVVVCTRDVVDAVWDLGPERHAALWAFVQKLARSMREQLPCERVCASVIGWAVRHAHVHLVPTDAPGQVPGLDGPPLPAELARAIAQKLRSGT